MPELPEVQTVVDDLNRMIKGCTIRDILVITRTIWRGGIPRKASLAGAAVKGLERKGKHIFMHLSNNHSIIFHLKMTGKLIVREQNDPIARHTHLIIKLDRGELRFNDVRRFGVVHYVKTKQIAKLDYIAALGPDALEIPMDDLVKRIRTKKRKIKSVLLDQRFISGLGNIYSDEILFASRINPSRIASKISVGKLKNLHGNMTLILKAAAQSRGSSISDYVDGSGNVGGFQNYHKVYGKAGRPCPDCGSRIMKLVISGRSSHYCPRCQR